MCYTWQGLKTGEISMVIGTHTLIADKTDFSALRISVIDEQQRFGVIQRGRFNNKVIYWPLLFTQLLTIHVVSACYFIPVLRCNFCNLVMDLKRNHTYHGVCLLIHSCRFCMHCFVVNNVKKKHGKDNQHFPTEFALLLIFLHAHALTSILIRRNKVHPHAPIPLQMLIFPIEHTVSYFWPSA